MRPGADPTVVKFWVEDVFSVTSGGLAIGNNQALQNFLGADALEGHIFCPSFIDGAVASQTVSWQGAI